MDLILSSRAEQLLEECAKAENNMNVIKAMAKQFLDLSNIKIDSKKIIEMLMMLDNISYPVMEFNIRKDSIDFSKYNADLAKYNDSSNTDISEQTVKESKYGSRGTNNSICEDLSNSVNDLSISETTADLSLNAKYSSCLSSTVPNVIDESNLEKLPIVNDKTDDFVKIQQDRHNDNESKIVLQDSENTNTLKECTETKDVLKSKINKKKKRNYKKRKNTYFEQVQDDKKNLTAMKNKTKIPIVSEPCTLKRSQHWTKTSQTDISLSSIEPTSIPTLAEENRSSSAMTDVSKDLLDWDDEFEKLEDLTIKIDSSPNLEMKTISKTPTNINESLKFASERSASNVDLSAIKNNTPSDNDVDDKFFSIEDNSRCLPDQEQFLSDDAFNCIITYAENPSSFYIIPQIYAEKHRTLLIDMNEYYQDKVDGFKDKRDILNGNWTLFAIKGISDEIWCRAILKDDLKDHENDIKIFCIDLGITLIASSTMVYPLCEKFYEYPPMAYHCCLDLIEPVDGGNWTKEATSYMNKYVFSTCSINISNIVDNILCAYILAEDDIVFNMDLVLLGIARFKSKDNINNTTKPLSHESDSNEEYIFDDAETGPDINVKFEGHDIQDEKMICKNYKGLPDTTCFKGARCKRAHIPFNPDGWTVEKVSIPTLPYKCLPKSKCLLNVKVTTVLDYKTFYMQILSVHNNSGMEEELDIEEFCKEKFIFNSMNQPDAIKSMKNLNNYPAIGEYVAVKPIENDVWLRGMVISLSGNHAEIFFVDYGNTEEIDYKNIKVLNSTYTMYIRQAIRCNLLNVKSAYPNKIDEAKKMLSEICFNNNIIAEIKCDELQFGTYEVCLRDETEFDIGETLSAYEFVELHSQDYITNIDESSIQNKYIPG